MIDICVYIYISIYIYVCVCALISRNGIIRNYLFWFSCFIYVNEGYFVVLIGSLLHVKHCKQSQNGATDLGRSAESRQLHHEHPSFAASTSIFYIIYTISTLNQKFVGLNHNFSAEIWWNPSFCMLKSSHVLAPPIAVENFPAPAPSMWSSQAVEVQLAENGALAQYARKDRLKRAAGRPGGGGAAIFGTI